MKSSKLMSREGLSIAMVSIGLVVRVQGQIAIETVTRPSLVTSDGLGTHTTIPGDAAFGVNHDGVGDLIINGSARCSASLLWTGRHLLTAAHCITDSAGAQTASSGVVTFELSGSNVQANVSSASSFAFHPSWDGNTLHGNDVAIVELDSEVSNLAPRYNIISKGGTDLDLQHVKIGYGRSGEGNTGDSLSSGTKRAGLNKWEDDGLNVGGITNRETQLSYDFDNGLAGNDAFGFFFGINDLGFGDDEVGAAPGDSGGPTFVDEGGSMVIAGVTSYGVRLSSEGSSTDVDGVINASFGEFGGDARLSNESLHDFVMSSVPEPEFYALIAGGALLGFAAFFRARRGQNGDSSAA